MGARIGMMRVKQVVVMGADMKKCGKKRKEGQRQNTEALKVSKWDHSTSNKYSREINSSGALIFFRQSWLLLTDVA